MDNAFSPTSSIGLLFLFEESVLFISRWWENQGCGPPFVQATRQESKMRFASILHSVCLWGRHIMVNVNSHVLHYCPVLRQTKMAATHML